MDISSYNKVREFVNKAILTSDNPQHGFDHFLRVEKNAIDIVETLGLKESVDINLLKSICLLHDVPQDVIKNFPLGLIGKHIWEKTIIKRELPKILASLPFSDKEKITTFNAIVNHPYSIPYRHLNRKGDIYTKILQDADSLDYFSNERLTSLKKAKDKHFIFKIGSLISKNYFKWGRENLHTFLNFPQIADNFYMKDQININNSSRTAVLIHGFPEPLYPDTPLFKYFRDKKYSIIAPYLFSPEYKLSQKNVDKYVEEKLGGKKPSVIVGVSMGGLLAPALAKRFPKAKLILIGTGPYVKPNVKSLHFLMRVGKSKFFDVLYRLIESTPTPIYSFLYRLFNHPKMTLTQKAELTEHIVKNWSSIKSVSEEEDREVINFLTSVDNTTLLKSLKNKTLIFAADGDSMMPLSLAQRLKEIIKGSKMIVNKGTIHYTVFGENNYKDMDEFLLSRV